MSPDDFADAVTARILPALTSALAPLFEAVTSSQALMTQSQLAKSMGVSVTQVKRFRAQGMPFVSLSKRCPRFRFTECIAWRTAKNEARKTVTPVIRRVSR